MTSATRKRVIPSTRAVFVVLAALAAAFAPISPRAIERWYSNGFYPLMQPTLTFASNAAPFALLDVLVAVVVASFVLLAARDALGGSTVRAAARIAVRAMLWASAVYLLFLVLWGFNYRRERLRDRMAFDPGAVTPAAASKLASTSVEHLNGLHHAAHLEGWPRSGTIDPTLASALDRATRELGTSGRVVAGRPKRSLLDWYFRRAGVAGMTDPFFLETLVASDLLPFERPLVVAHEWAHLAGLADEGEANAVGWFICVQASPASQYSGWLFMFDEIVRVLPPAERAALAGRLGPGPRADLKAIRDRVAASVNPRVAAAGWRVYDSYLKSNRVESGARSYDEVVQLALGLQILRTY